MVKKLFKHEFLAVFRTWLPVQIIMLAVAVFGRILQFFETDTNVYNIIFTSTTVIYVLAIFAAVMLTLIFGIIRFHKNLFTGEGYLSFTLPVTPTQHILAKTLVAGASMLGTLLVAFVSFMIFTSGEVFGEVMKAIGYIIRFFASEFGTGHMIAYVFEGIVLVAIALLGAYLFYYFCIALGQTFRKNRVLGAVGVYFICYTISQVISTAIIIVMSFLAETDFFQWIGEFADAHPSATVHIVLCAAIALSALLTAVYFVVVRYVIRNKLNLE